MPVPLCMLVTWLSNCRRWASAEPLPTVTYRYLPLQAGLCWTPLVLESSRLRLRFGESFELGATFDPANAAVTSVQILSLMAASAPEPHVHALRALFEVMAPGIDAQLQACRSPAAVAALLPSISVRLGRLLDLGREISALSQQVRLAWPRAPRVTTLPFVAPRAPSGATLTPFRPLRRYASRAPHDVTLHPLRRLPLSLLLQR